MLPVPDARPWPDMQRFDFLVRTRALTDEEARAYFAEAQEDAAGGSPYREAALAALRRLTGRDAGPTADGWRRLLGLAGARRAE
jgi:hypothetical protein